MEPKIPHDPSRIVGQWAVGLNSRIGKVVEVKHDHVGPVYHGVCLNGDLWWTRAPTVLDSRDQEALNRRNQCD